MAPLISEQSQPQLENTGTWRDNTLHLIGLWCSLRLLTGNVLKQLGAAARKQGIEDGDGRGAKRPQTLLLLRNYGNCLLLESRVINTPVSFIYLCIWMQTTEVSPRSLMGIIEMQSTDGNECSSSSEIFIGWLFWSRCNYDRCSR